MRWIGVVLVVVTLGACGADEGVAIRRWQLGGEVATAAGAEVELPARLGGVADRAGTYTLSARVAVPDRWRGAPLTLVVADVPAIAHLAVDGADALANDAPPPGAYRSRGPLRWGIPRDATADGVLELVFTVEHRWTQGAWWNAAPTLVAGDAQPAAATGVLVANLYVAIAALISLVQIGITALLVYLSDRQRRAYLWFSLQSFGAAYYPLFILGFTQHVFGVYDVPVLAFTLVAAALISIHFTHEFFELPPPWRGFTVIAAAATAVFAACHDPFVATPVSGPVAIAALGLLTGYQLVVCARLARTHPDRQVARIHLIAWIALCALMPFDMLYWLGVQDPLDGARPAPLGLLGMGVCLSLLVGRRHLSSLHELTAALRRQVAERSTQLFSALALVGGRGARAPELAVGQVVHARYRIVAERGRGGMGTVYEVERVADGRRLALKLTHEVSGPAMARLAREALIGSKIDHRNLVGVVDVDVDDGFLYVVMELVDGTSLKALRDRHGDPAWAVPLLAQIARGLAALHATGVVHRDLKPANLLLTEGGDGRPLVKITDFGVSRHLPGVWASSSEDAADESDAGDTEPEEIETETAIGVGGPTEVTAPISARRRRAATGGLTRTGMLVGTPAYIAPELVDGPQALSPAADLFAFGVIAWELITGERPFERPAVYERMHGHPLATPAPLATRWAGATPAIAALIDRCLSLDPTARPTAAEAADVLDRR